MIEKHTFCDTIICLRSYLDGLDSFEKSLGTYFTGNFLTDIIGKTITTLAQGFFSTREIDEYFVGGTLCDDSDETFKWNFETIEELLYHYTCSADFGRELGMMDETYKITDADDKVVKSYNGDTPEEVYTIIVDFLNRDDSYYHTINCCSVGRGKVAKNETDIS